MANHYSFDHFFSTSISFTTAVPLATDVFGARFILWSGTGNEYDGFGINSSVLNYNFPAFSTHTFYVGTTVMCSLSSTGLNLRGCTTVTQTSTFFHWYVYVCITICWCQMSLPVHTFFTNRCCASISVS